MVDATDDTTQPGSLGYALSGAAAPSPRANGAEQSALRGATDTYRARQQHSDDLAARAEKQISSMTPPKLVELPPEPKAQHTDPAMEWGSLAMMFAAFGSLATRRPFTSALTSAAAVINAYNQGDRVRSEDALKRWKVETQNAERMAQFQNDQYKFALDQAKTGVEFAKLAAPTAHALKDDMVLRLMDSGHTDEAMKLVAGRRAAGNGLGAGSERAMNYMMARMTYTDWKKEYASQHPDQPEAPSAVANAAWHAIERGDDPGAAATKVTPSQDRAAVEADVRHENPTWTPGQVAIETKKRLEGTHQLGSATSEEADVQAIADAAIKKKEDETGQPLTAAEKAEIRVETRNTNKGAKQRAGDAPLTEEQATFFADQVLAGDKTPYSQLGRNKSGLEQLRTAVAKLAKERNISGTDLAAINARFTSALREAGAIGQRVGAIEVSGAEAKRVASLVDNAYSKLPRGDFRPMNQLQTMYDNGTNSPEQGAAYLADFSMVTAYARALNPQGVPREADIEHASKILNSAGDSYERHMAVVGQMLKELDQIEGATGDARKALVGRIKSDQGFTKKPTGGAVRYDAQGNRVQ